ncbi:MAG TPA: hypothetical protein PLD59_16090 [Tepidisphaeraceae bacterium]|nr:hypothetical protein [Tepidisphaeraceae bacterium]
MRFLIHGNLAPAVHAAVTRHGHVAATLDMAELPPDIAPEDLLKELHRKQLDLITNDDAVIHAALKGDGAFERCIAHLQLTGGEVEQDDAIDRLFERYPRMSNRRLYTVTETRVKVRQLPGGR